MVGTSSSIPGGFVKLGASGRAQEDTRDPPPRRCAPPSSPKGARVVESLLQPLSPLGERVAHGSARVRGSDPSPTLKWDRALAPISTAPCVKESSCYNGELTIRIVSKVKTEPHGPGRQRLTVIATLGLVLITTAALAWQDQLAVAAREARPLLVAQLQGSTPQPQTLYEVRAIHDPNGTGRILPGPGDRASHGAGRYCLARFARSAKTRSALTW